MRSQNVRVVGAVLLSLQAQGTPRTAPPASPPSPPITQEKPGLFAKAKVTADAARATALAAVPGGLVKKGELEQEGGKLIFSFDIKVPGKRGIEEIHVDAMTGPVINREHEADVPATKTPPPPPKKP